MGELENITKIVRFVFLIFCILGNASGYYWPEQLILNKIWGWFPRSRILKPGQTMSKTCFWFTVWFVGHGVMWNREVIDSNTNAMLEQTWIHYKNALNMRETYRKSYQNLGEHRNHEERQEVYTNMEDNTANIVNIRIKHEKLENCTVKAYSKKRHWSVREFGSLFFEPSLRTLDTALFAYSLPWGTRRWIIIG